MNHRATKRRIHEKFNSTHTEISKILITTGAGNFGQHGRIAAAGNGNRRVLKRNNYLEAGMHEKTKVEKKLKLLAKQISKGHENAPVVIIVGGTGLRIPRTMTASSFSEKRLRDLLGFLEASIQIETLKHFKLIKR